MPSIYLPHFYSKVDNNLELYGKNSPLKRNEKYSKHSIVSRFTKGYKIGLAICFQSINQINKNQNFVITFILKDKKSLNLLIK